MLDKLKNELKDASAKLADLRICQSEIGSKISDLERESEKLLEDEHALLEEIERVERYLGDQS